MRGYLRNVVIGGVALLGLGVKRLVLGPGALVSNPWLFGVSAAATIVSGYPFLRGAMRTATGKSGINTDTLVGSATIASIIMRENVTALSVVWLLNIGEYLQAITLRRTRQAIRSLLEVEDGDVWLVLDGQELKTPLAQIEPGHTIAIYAGQRIPVDGEIVGGSGTINEAPITGESMPVIRNIEDEVFAGTLLMTGDLKIRVTRIGSDTAVGRLIQRVEEAQNLRAPIQTIGERFSERFVPTSFVLSGLVFALTGNINRALTMLLVACPCAAGLATPTAVSATIGNAARRGILIKGGTHLESSADLDCIVFDKTGTLTEGMPSVQRVIALTDEYTADAVLSIAATGELHSQHPLALAVVQHANDCEITIPPHEECEIIVGKGMHAFGEDRRVLVGNERLLEQFNVQLPEAARTSYDEHSANGETMMYVASNSEVIGLIGVRDTIRPEAAPTLRELRQLGVERLVMLTGDGEESAASVSRIVGLDEWQSRLLPEQKYDLIKEFRANGNQVAMVGDGINDAPALALADVGVAMGTGGSDVAIEAADVALAGDNIRRVATTVRLSRRAIKVIRQNYAMALGVNSIGVVVGAFGVINPLLAATLHNLSTLLVVANSARLIGFDPDKTRL
ncbi:MAG: copper-translocating P-type ATPase [Planctomycetaceae bacterium]|nr:copper-translocating P-type ATPase [Planctomycetaceae bacterium]